MTSPTLACPACGSDNRADRRFCRACGSELGAVCASCGAPSDGAARDDGVGEGAPASGEATAV